MDFGECLFNGMVDEVMVDLGVLFVSVDCMLLKNGDGCFLGVDLLMIGIIVVFYL